MVPTGPVWLIPPIFYIGFSAGVPGKGKEKDANS